MSIKKYLGRQGLARYLEISTTRVTQIDPKPNILLDGAPGWLPETAARLKRKREVRPPCAAARSIGCHRRNSMSDWVLIALSDGRWLALSAEALEGALRAAAESIGAAAASGTRGANVEPLLSAEEAGQQCGVTARWLEDSARAGIVPHFKFGGTRRFRVSELADHFRIAGAPPPTNSESVAPFRRLARP